ARAQIAERRDALWAHVDDLLADAGLADEPWVEPWLNEIRRAGTLTRLGDEARNMAASAVAVLRTTLGPVPATPIGRNVLAQQYSGSAHGLDDSTVLGRLVLRALAHAFGVPNPMSAADRRVLWRAAGVAPDNVSTTVLTIGLRPTGSVFADLHRQRTDAGAETHLDDRDVARINWELPAGTVVHVCENPRIVEDALDVGIDAPLVCTLGSPTTVAANLVTGLLEGGAHLRYHGDFDWPGIAITARMLKLGCEPWRMTAADYEEALAIATPLVGNLPALVGEPVPTPWDRELAAAMNAIGRVVHEEALVAVLLGDLAGS
ncbi:MAG: TIGR02679 family protein, partial [Acidimicrobiia bacterium]